MKCYQDTGNLTARQKSFNFRQIRTRRVVEQAFGRLKGRFWVLEHNYFRDPTYLSQIRAVCCGLRNICDRWQCPTSKRWTIKKTLYHPRRNDRINNQVDGNAEQVRDVLARQVHATKPA